MRLTSTITRERSLALALALALLTACGDDSPAPTAPVDATTDVGVVFCTGSAPAWVAFQDGDGAWTRAEATVAGSFTTFHRTFGTARGAMATARDFASGFTALTVRYGAPTELALFGDTGPANCAATNRTLLGTVAGLDTNEVALVSAGIFGSRDLSFRIEDDPFTLFDLAAGPQDLVASRVRVVRDSATITGIILRRGIELPDSATMPVLDFGSPEAFQPARGTVTLVGLGPEGADTQVGFRTTRSNHFLNFVYGLPTAASRSYDAIPESRLEPGDLHVLTATTPPVTANIRRAATLFFRSPTDRTLALGAVPEAPALSIASATPTLRPRALFASHADYDRLTSISWQQGQTVVSVSMTPAYAAGSASGYDLIVPELTGVAGFEQRWALRPTGQMIWQAGRIGGTLGLVPSAAPRDGDTRRTASDAGFLTP